MTSTVPAYEDLETYRRELTGYCYRMLGSGAEAEDAVQETLVRAWRAADRFEGRSSVRSWVYRIATNVCLDMQKGAERRARPIDLGPPSAPREENLGPWLEQARWISPVADDRIIPDTADPAEVAEARESVRLAFVAALQHLPGRQRAVLVLCEVLKWQASEAAALLDTSVAAVNSALQRARATLADAAAPAPSQSAPSQSAPSQSAPSQAPPSQAAPSRPGRPQLAGSDAELLAAYVDAFESYDIDRLVTLLRHDAIMSMPPFPMWLRGAPDIGEWMVQPGPSGCAGSVLLPTAANGCPAFGQYRRDPAGGWTPWGLQVLEIHDGRVSGLHVFLHTAEIFPLFGLPDHLDRRP